MKLTILNTREVKKIKAMLEEHFGYSLQEDYAYLQNEKNRLFIINKALTKVNLQNLKIDRIGLYFAEVKNNQIRLSKEGAQLLALEAKKNKKELKNIVTLNKEEVKKYFVGEDLEKNLGKEASFKLLQYDRNVLGCAKYKERKILNYLPKAHRGEVIL